MTCLYKFNPKLEDKKRKSCYAYKKKTLKKRILSNFYFFKYALASRDMEY